MAMTSKEKKEWAQSLFLTTDKSQQEIAERVGVSENTLTSWKQAGNWEVIRGATTATRPQMVAAFYEQINLIRKSAVDAEGKPRPMTLNETSSIRMITKSIAELDKTLSADSYVQIMEEFVKWFFAADRAAAKPFLPWLDRFMEEKFRTLG
jgi:transposase-like protein